MIIVFSGTDGAGKSTQIGILNEELLQKNYKVKHFWGRGGYTPLFQFLKTQARMLLGKKRMPQGPTKSRNELMMRKSVSRLWLSIASIDMILFYGLYVRWLSAIGYVVIRDRYVEDTYLDFKRNFGDNFNEHGLLWKSVTFFSPKPDYAFLLHVPVEVSLERSRLKNEPFPDSSETLAYRLDNYLDESNFSSVCFYKIDCCQSIQDVYAQIHKHLRDVM